MITNSHEAKKRTGDAMRIHCICIDDRKGRGLVRVGTCSKRLFIPHVFLVKPPSGSDGSVLSTEKGVEEWNRKAFWVSFLGFLGMCISLISMQEEFEGLPGISRLLLPSRERGEVTPPLHHGRHVALAQADGDSHVY